MTEDRNTGHVANPLLTETALLDYDTAFDRADYTGEPDRPVLSDGNAVDRGWQPLDAVVPGGVQVVPLSTLVPGVPFGSAAHFYVGEREGERMLAIAFRGTDEGPDEFAFLLTTVGTRPDGTPIYGADFYQAAHAEAVATALAYAQDPAHDIDRVLITGHSLGGIIAELTTARVLDTPAFVDLAARTETITFGSPGSTADAQGNAIFNLIHSDDLVARISDLSPLLVAAHVHREGVALSMARSEGTLPPFRPEDLDTPQEVLQALLDPANRVEHGILHYIDTARLLDDGQHVMPGVARHPGEPDRWQEIAVDRGTVGTADADTLEGTWRGEILFGRDGDDRIYGGYGADGLSGGSGNDLLHGGPGDDLLDGNAGDDRIRAARGNDTIHLSTGRDTIEGGRGRDTVVIDRSIEDLRIEFGHGRVVVIGDRVHATLTGVERLVLENGIHRAGQHDPAFLPDDPARFWRYHAETDHLL
ncbi:lipase family protein [Benzoatithermus flavus]|uniref:Fungal lipase-type domain-containing protein n=1 Tax=Benzoatithermus flavus TaxID=3108223 RepID=A0ABU8XYK0_9PROT